MIPADLASMWRDWFPGEVTAAASFGLLTVDVPAERWTAALTFARDDLDCRFLDWLAGVDETPGGFGVVAHVYSREQNHHLLVRTTVDRDNPVLPTATGLYRGADWHEREAAEMFGLVFEGHPNPGPLLLPDEFEGHPLRKDFVLAARVAKAWPGAKEPGQGGAAGGGAGSDGAPGRRRNLPPGVPPDWGHDA